MLDNQTTFNVERFLEDINYQNGSNPKYEEEGEENDDVNINDNKDLDLSWKYIILQNFEQQYNDTWKKRENIGKNFLFYHLIVFMLFVIQFIVDNKTNSSK